MAGYYNKDSLKAQLDVEQIYDLLVQLGGEPEYVDTGLISQTICHNPPGEGSRKLYYYSNSHLFNCYSGCEEPSFDVFQLVIKAMKIQKNVDYELYDAMCYVAEYFGLAEATRPEERNNELLDWDILKRHDYLHFQSFNAPKAQLREYNPSILLNFSYPRILNWEAEGIAKEVCRSNLIGYYPGKEQITIPHFDINNRLVGIRGRSLSEEEAERYGKYKPLKINGQLYNHPLSMNLYNLNKSKEAIKRAKAAIIFESEKSCLLSQTYYKENDISVACCGSSISNYQIELLTGVGAEEIVIAFDRQFQEINSNDEEFQHLKKKLISFYKKYHNKVKITAIFDKNMITSYKASPIDEGFQTFEKLLQERIIPNE
jgi:hypothetical protein